MNTSEQLHIKLQKIRLALGLSALEFAKLAGIEEEEVIQVESCTKEMSAAYFIKVVQSFCISADRLIVSDVEKTDYKTLLYDPYSPLDARYESIKSKGFSADC